MTDDNPTWQQRLGSARLHKMQQQTLDDARALIDRYYEWAVELLRDTYLAAALERADIRPGTSFTERLTILARDTEAMGFGDEHWERDE